MSYEPRSQNLSGIFFHGGTPTDPIYQNSSLFAYNNSDSRMSVPKISGVNSFAVNENGAIGTPTVSGLVYFAGNIVSFASGARFDYDLTGTPNLRNAQIASNAAIAVTKLQSSGLTFTPTAGGGANQFVVLGDTLTFTRGSGIAVYAGTTGRDVIIGLSGQLASNAYVGSATKIPVLSINQNGIVFAASEATVGVGAYSTFVFNGGAPIGTTLTLTSSSPRMILCSGGATNLNVTLPSAADAASSGVEFIIKKIDYGNSTVTVLLGNGTNTFDGAVGGSKLLTQRNETISCVADGGVGPIVAGWWII